MLSMEVTFIVAKKNKQQNRNETEFAADNAVTGTVNKPAQKNANQQNR